MLTVNSINNNTVNYQPAFRAENLEQIRSNLKAMEKEITIQDQEVIQTKIAELKLGHKVAQFFRTLFTGVSINKNAVQHFRNKYGSFYLTKKGLEQYMKIMPDLLNAKAKVDALNSERYLLSSEKNSLASYQSTVAILLSKINLLKYLGEINTTSGKEHYFRDQHGKFTLTDKGLEQYMDIIKDLESARAKNRLLRYERHITHSEVAPIVSNRSTVAICLSNLDLLKSLGKIDTTHGQQHQFKGQYGKFNLTDKGLNQYMDIITTLAKANATVETMCSLISTDSSDRRVIADNQGTIATSKYKLDILKQLGELPDNI